MEDLLYKFDRCKIKYLSRDLEDRLKTDLFILTRLYHCRDPAFFFETLFENIRHVDYEIIRRKMTDRSYITDALTSMRFPFILSNGFERYILEYLEHLKERIVWV
jgi:hypothetical protein